MNTINLWLWVKRTLLMVAVAYSVLFAPLAFAAMYAPGATLAPACAPTDTNCGVIASVYTSDTLTNGALLFASSSAWSLLPIGTDGQVLKLSGGLPAWSVDSGITSLNGLTGQTQTFATSTTGTDFTITSSGTTHTFNLPSAASTVRGLLTSADWTTFNSKLTSTLNSANIFVGNASSVATGVSLSGDATISNAGALTIANDAIILAKLATDSVNSAKIVDGSVALADLASNSVNSAKIVDGSIVDADINASATIALSKLASGASIATSLAAPTGTNANGGSITSNVLTLSLADGTNPGLVSTGAQTIAGSKTFSSALIAPTSTDTINGLVINSGALSNIASIAGSGALAISSGGTNQNITLTPSGTGYTILNGNVGIGTTTPATSLHIAGTSASNKIQSDIGLDFKIVTAPPATSAISLIALAGNVDAGQHYYYITYATAYGETNLSQTSPISVTTDAGNGQVQITLPIAQDYRVTARKIYRTTAGSASYANVKLVATVSDNTTSSYTDNIADSSLTGTNYYYKDNSTNGYISVSGTKAFFPGLNNTTVGLGAGQNLTTGGRNVIMGASAGSVMTTATQNTIIGHSAAASLSSGTNNVAIATYALYSNTTGSGNIGIGYDAGFYTTGNYNVLIGDYAGVGASGLSTYGSSVGIGANALNALTTGGTNVAIGSNAGKLLTSGSSNVFLGNSAGYNSTTTGNQFFLNNIQQSSYANDQNYSLLYGKFSGVAGSLTGQQLVVNGNVGIGTTTPSYKLQVFGAASTDAISSTGGYDINAVLNPTSLSAALIATPGNVNAGLHYYRVTYYTSLGETGASAAGPSVTTDASNGQVTVTIPVSTDSRVIGRKIYRSVANGQSWNTNSLATVADNTTTTYVDNIADASLGTRNGYFSENTTTKYITIGGTAALLVGSGMEPNTILGKGAGATYFSGTAVGGSNNLFGASSGAGLTTGVKNDAHGNIALGAVTTGSSNEAMGWYSLGRVTTGGGNVGIGNSAGFQNVTGSNNVYLGAYSGQGVSGQSHNYNTFIGSNSGYGITTGGSNTTLGYQTGYTLTTGGSNVFLGNKAGYSDSTGGSNVFLGNYAGYNETGSNAFYLGNIQQSSLANDQNYSLLYGKFSGVAGSLTGQQLTVNGNLGVGTTTPANALTVVGSISQTGCVSAGGISVDATGKIICTSDERLKNLLGVNPYGLQTILGINPIKYTLKGEDYQHIGFSAQNVQQVLPEATPLQNNGYLGIDTNAITATLVDAVKEQQEQIEIIKEQLALAQTSGQGGVSISTLNQLTISGALSVDGHITLGKDTVGEATVPAGAASVTITFDNVYTEKPAITVTPEEQINGTYWVTITDGNGFKINISQAQNSDATFSWHAFAQKGKAFTATYGSSPTAQDTTAQNGSDNNDNATMSGIASTTPTVDVVPSEPISSVASSTATVAPEIDGATASSTPLVTSTASEAAPVLDQTAAATSTSDAQ